jgi:hypothetical protein
MVKPRRPIDENPPFLAMHLDGRNHSVLLKERE